MEELLRDADEVLPYLADAWLADEDNNRYYLRYKTYNRVTVNNQEYAYYDGPLWKNLMFIAYQYEMYTKVKQFPANIKAPRTQKARGILALKKNGTAAVERQPEVSGVFNASTVAAQNESWDGEYYKGYTNPDEYIIYGSSLTKRRHLDFPAFVRPAPMTPRHGFVDSRIVNDVQEFIEIARETVAADPEGELIVMPYIDAVASAVAFDGGISWGLGNDGVTGGTSKSVTVATPSASRERWIKDVNRYTATEVAEDETLYVEIVADKWKANAVQLRSGPAADLGSPDWVTVPFTVKEVLKKDPHNDSLLDWEASVLRFAKGGIEGKVVYLPDMALSSHWAVHAIQSRLPVVTSFEPKVGKRLEATHARKGEIDYKRLAEGVKAVELVRDMHGGELKFAFGVLHSMSLWNFEENPHLYDMVSQALVALPRYAAAAVIGEARHFERQNVKNDGSNYEDFRWMVQKLKREGVHRMRERSSVYTDAFTGDLTDLIKRVNLSYDAYMNYRWEGGYGGEKWGQSAKATARALKRLRVFLRWPNADSFAALVMAENALANEVHNNGPMLSKFVSGEFLDTVAEFPVVAFTTLYAANRFLKAGLGKGVEYGMGVWDYENDIEDEGDEEEGYHR